MTQQAIIDFLNDFNPSGIALTPEQVNQLSVSVPNAQGATTVLYSGQIGNGVHSGAVAQALADASPGQIATIDQTEVAALLDEKNLTIGYVPIFHANNQRISVSVPIIPHFDEPNDDLK